MRYEKIFLQKMRRKVSVFEKQNKKKLKPRKKIKHL